MCNQATTLVVFTQARADSEFAVEAGADMADGEDEGQENKPTGPAWEGTDRDYSYEELLGRSHNCVQCIAVQLFGLQHPSALQELSFQLATAVFDLQMPLPLGPGSCILRLLAIICSHAFKSP